MSELGVRGALSGAGGRGAACCVRALFMEGNWLASMSVRVRLLLFDILRNGIVELIML